MGTLETAPCASGTPPQGGYLHWHGWVPLHVPVYTGNHYLRVPQFVFPLSCEPLWLGRDHHATAEHWCQFHRFVLEPSEGPSWCVPNRR